MTAKTGQIFLFASKKVAGYAKRNKYHLAIDLRCGFLLFINSEPFEGAFKITRTDWPMMPKEVSYIACNSAVNYSKADLKDVEITPHGSITDECLTRLRDHLLKSIVLPLQDVEVAVQAINEHLGD